MQGDYKTINDGLVLLSTLIAWNFGLDWLSYRSKLVAHLVEPAAAVLVRNGRPCMRTLRQQMITVDELKGKLREEGVEDVMQVRIARLESDGQLSVFKKHRGKTSSPPKDVGPPGG